MQFPQVGPEAVLGIEINPYAAELARVTIWIGEIQWMLAHGFAYLRDPILQAARQHRGAGRAARPVSDPAQPARGRVAGGRGHHRQPAVPRRQAAAREPRRRVRRALFAVFDDRVPREADFVCYWHEKARAMVEAGERGASAACDPGHPRRRQPPRARADQGERRHLLRLVGRAVGARRRGRPRQLRRLRRRLGAGATPRRRARRVDQRQPDERHRSDRAHGGCPRTRASPSWAT